MKKTLLFVAGLTMAVMPAVAQKLATGYITMPQSGYLQDYVPAWNGGSGTIYVDGKAWEDEEFFISRVKPKVRFYNTASQVRQDLTQYSTSNPNGTDKRYLNWVPINDPEFNAIPNGIWDQDVFSMWSYLDHYGDWTAPYGFVPGAFSDVAHKNGVAVSGVASVPWGTIAASWKSAFQAMERLDANALGKFLHYFGVDGLGYNSEWNGYDPEPGLTNLHNGLKNYMASRNPIWENIWYGGTNDNGAIAFDSGIGSFTKLYQGASIFHNYNWNSSSTMQNDIKLSKNAGKNPFFIYAGMNQQGGEPKSGRNYDLLKDYQYSIGMWGAHSYNMFWEGRGAAGTTTEAIQKHYLDINERWYTGAERNPAVRYAIQTVRDHRPKPDWAGISSMVSARSTLGWDIYDEPFYTYFNLGNGKFFNWEGECISENPWYSIGVQDYLPTWRYWFAPTFMNGNISKNDVSLDATFTWEDAYFGGSCMQISGTSANEYLHLFKTNFTVGDYQSITIRYKLLEGSANVGLVLSTAKDPKTAVHDGDLTLFTKEGSAEVCDNSYKKGKDGWQEATFEIGWDTSYDLVNDGIGVIGLKFTDAENMKLLLGELRIELEGNYGGAPATPVVKSTKVLSNSTTGVDGKIIWKMPNNKSVGEPCYNSDVNVSMFKVYAQEQGGEAEFLGVTTSWAAVAFRAKNTDNNKQIRFGVSAVSEDHKSESAIAWGNYMSKGSYKASDEVVIDKAVIKANEEFTVRYLDPKHSSSSWALVNTAGQTVASGNGVELHVATGLAEGGYDLYLDRGTANERHLGYFVQITSESVGALPEIYTISRDGASVSEGDASVEIELTDTPTLSYTGRKADGSASRCVSLNSRYIGCKVGDLGIGGTNTSISVAGWFKFKEMPDKVCNFMNISNKAASWPQNTWGWAWNKIYPTTSGGGVIECTFRGAASDASAPGELHYQFPNTILQPGVWVHIAWICEYSSSGFRCQLYINGVKQESRWYQYAVGNNGGSARSVGGKTYGWSTGHPDETQGGYTGGRLGNMTTDEWCSGQTFQYTANDWIYFGGAAHMGSAIDGIVDDFQVWNKAMSAEDVKKSMNGINRTNINGLNVMCLWDFESEHGSDNGFQAIGTKSNVKAYSFDYAGNAESGNMQWTAYIPSYTSGCPFLSGTAYPVVTEAVWKDADDRKTQFTATTTGATGGEAGKADVKFVNPGDHTVTLSLQNSYGADTRQFPVFSVKETQGIEDIVADGGEMNAYTVENVLFLEFGADGAYDVEVYNAAGVLVATKQLNAVAGQNARITLGAKGVYMVKASVNGELLRTVKVLNK